MIQRVRQKSVIGVEVGAKTLKALQLLGDVNHPSGVRSLCMTRVDQGEKLSERDAFRLSDGLYRQGFVGNTMVVGIPHNMQLMSLVELPVKDGNAPVGAIVRNQIANQYHIPPEGITCAYWRMPGPHRGAETIKGLAVGCRDEHAENLMNVFEDAGYDVSALDVQSCASARAAEFTVGDETDKQMIAVLDIGWSCTTIILVVDHTIVYVRSLEECNLRQLHELLEERFELNEHEVGYILKQYGVKPADEDQVRAMSQLPALQNKVRDYYDQIIKHLNVSVSYAEHEYQDYKITHAVLSGGGAELLGVVDYMNMYINFNCRRFTIRSEDDTTKDIDAGFLGAYGLALRKGVAA